MSGYSKGVTPSAPATNSRRSFSRIPPGGDCAVEDGSATRRREPAQPSLDSRRSFVIRVAYSSSVGYRIYVERNGRRFMLPAEAMLCELDHLTTCLGECADHRH